MPDQALHARLDTHFYRLYQQYMTERDDPQGDRVKTDIPSTDAEKEVKKRELYGLLPAQHHKPANNWRRDLEGGYPVGPSYEATGHIDR
ncbi:hypothetical protein QBC40DRAFT_249411 [Triangularia verruculosa]|uniref:Uncharacterized protein n=1 Tax=Triangularia verruculosa TaxID=2587418 RepID=A0AAN6XQK4_9PEZI|nr:hypothetical protein QBC40DRAFT_249411 [Triangularia verruculosa]